MFKLLKFDRSLPLHIPHYFNFNFNLTFRYKLHLVVRDETGVTTCVVLHRLAEQMIDSSALKLFNKYDSNSDEFPKEIKNLCGKKLIFKLQLSDFNLKRGSDVFSVYNVFEPIDTLEEKYKSMVSVEVRLYLLIFLRYKLFYILYMSFHRSLSRTTIQATIQQVVAFA